MCECEGGITCLLYAVEVGSVNPCAQLPYLLVDHVATWHRSYGGDKEEGYNRGDKRGGL